MNYQTIKLKGGAEVQTDMDERRTQCQKCGELIRFGITKNGKKMPIIETMRGEWQSHFVDCPFREHFRKGPTEAKIEQENTNQDFLNNL